MPSAQAIWSVLAQLVEQNGCYLLMSGEVLTLLKWMETVEPYFSDPSLAGNTKRLGAYHSRAYGAGRTSFPGCRKPGFSAGTNTRQ